MTQGAHDAGGGFGQSASGNAARGALVIVAALLLGFVLLQQGLSGSDDDDSAVGATTGTTAVSDDGTTGTTSIDNPDGPAEEVTTSTLGAPRPASEVAVLVLNGTDGPVAGIAGKGSDKLKTNNYITRDAKNASTPSPSAVYYTAGFEAEARVVAEVLGASPDAVVSALDPATVPIDDTQSANIVVVVGNDGVIVV